VTLIAKTVSFAKRIWAAAPIATVVLALALAAILFFGVRSVVFWHDRPPRAEREQPVASWMTPRYIARSWKVPPKLIAEAIEAPMPPPDGPMSLKQIANLRGVPVEKVIAEAEAVISETRGPRNEEGAGRDPVSEVADE
jgi:hypothetical protein